MSVKIIYNEDGGLIIEGSGIFSDADLVNADNMIYKDEARIKKITYQIFDISRAEKVTLSNHKIIDIAESDKRALEINPNMRIAIFGDSKLVFGLGRMWEIHACGDSNCKVFDNWSELVEWIQSETGCDLSKNVRKTGMG